MVANRRQDRPYPHAFRRSSAPSHPHLHRVYGGRGYNASTLHREDFLKRFDQDNVIPQDNAFEAEHTGSQAVDVFVTSET